MSSELLIKNLQNAALFNHNTQYFKVIETHISWVILTGEYVYKIKKPMNFGFLDFSTLEQRKQFCTKELELNQKLAPELYLDVLAITGTETNPEFNGKGAPIEYAIKMREFPQSSLFDALLKINALHSMHIIDLAHELANFHEKTDTDTPDFFGTPEQIFEPVVQNFEQIREMLKDKKDLSELEKVETWSYAEHKKLTPVFNHRKLHGFIRACHGDVHLGNITLYHDKPMIFDCIEFNESFRWTDTMADLGFLLMDLYEKNQPRFANILLNTYMLHTGDYAGLQVLPYYQVYRAVVRAKISLFEYVQQTDATEAEKRLQKYRKFITLAQSFINKDKPYLLLTHGMSGSGKSTLAKLLVEKLGLVQLRSDVERKRMAGIPINESSHSGLYTDLYSEQQTQKTYQLLLELTKLSLNSGYSTIVDATFQTEQQRKLFIDYAKQHEMPYCILYCQASLDKLLEWVTTRSMDVSISEANKDVLIAQQDKFEPLTSEEIRHCISINTANPVDANIILQSIKELLD